MELQFDKEMDAILRKARGTRGVLVGDSPPKHLDADVIAAFAENAVPPKAKLLYMEHFADCDSCRRTLSSTILMNTEAAAATASSVVSEPVAAVVPWYFKIFRTPNLALAMGALVLTFGGVLGYLVLLNRNDVNSASVAKVADKQPEHTYSGIEQSANTTTVGNSANASAANAATNMSAAANALVSEPVRSMSGPSPEAESQSLAGRTYSPGAGPVDTRSKTGSMDGVSPDAAKPTSAAPPPPPPAQQPVVRDEKKAGEDKQKDDVTKEVMSKTETNDAYGRNDTAAARKASGPNRAGIVSGPRNVQQQMENNTKNSIGNGGMAAPTRSSGGKTFESRDGVWYDRSYHGQATNNYRRGTDEYKKLDGGLRKIADSIGGTVVVVWKSKAYRIQ